MSGYKPFLALTVLSTERRNSRLLFAPTSQVQQSSWTRGVGKSSTCGAVYVIVFKLVKIRNFLYMIEKIEYLLDNIYSVIKNI